MPGPAPLFRSILLLLVFVPGWSGDERLALLGRRPIMSAAPVLFDPTDRNRNRVGALVWMGGIRLTSPDPAFGGFSSLGIDGRIVTLLSDGGNIVSAPLGWRGSVPPRGRIAVRFAELPDGPGRGWEKSERDSESQTIDRRTGKIWVGFENSNAIWRYAPGFSHAEAHAVPPAMAWWPGNKGPEAIALMPGGGMVVFDETTPWPHGQGRAAIRFSGDPTEAPRAGYRFSYLPPVGYDPSDMAVLPGGDLLVLNRRFELPFRFSAVLTIVPAAAIHPGARVAGRPIARFAAPLIHDNFEGVAVTHEGRDTIVWLVSDDNQLFLQQSLLLKFKLDPRALVAK